MLPLKLPTGLRLSGAAVLILMLSGCGDGLPRTYPCKGMVRVNGKPVKDARVAFYYQGDLGGRTIVPMAWTEEDGSFVLSTFRSEDGAPAGDYEVTIIWPQYRNMRSGDGPDRLQGRFADGKKGGLRAQVEAKDNELPPFELNGPVLPPQASSTGKRKRD